MKTENLQNKKVKVIQEKDATTFEKSVNDFLEYCNRNRYPVIQLFFSHKEKFNCVVYYSGLANDSCGGPISKEQEFDNFKLSTLGQNNNAVPSYVTGIRNNFEEEQECKWDKVF